MRRGRQTICNQNGYCLFCSHHRPFPFTSILVPPNRTYYPHVHLRVRDAKLGRTQIKANLGKRSRCKPGGCTGMCDDLLATPVHWNIRPVLVQATQKRFDGITSGPLRTVYVPFVAGQIFWPTHGRCITAQTDPSGSRESSPPTLASSSR